MEGLCLAIIDTPQFQRLGSITQLGACPLVYRGATHTRWGGREGGRDTFLVNSRAIPPSLPPSLLRLQHSLGVAHLAGEFVKTLLKNQADLLREGEEDGGREGRESKHLPFLTIPLPPPSSRPTC